jgi:hypothetical protein
LDRLPAPVRAEIIRRPIDRTREVARKYVMLAHPEIMQAATQAKLKALSIGDE